MFSFKPKANIITIRSFRLCNILNTNTKVVVKIIRPKINNKKVPILKHFKNKDINPSLNSKQFYFLDYLS